MSPLVRIAAATVLDEMIADPSWDEKVVEVCGLSVVTHRDEFGPWVSVVFHDLKTRMQFILDEHNGAGIVERI
jgi:hypothetical protein